MSFVIIVNQRFKGYAFRHFVKEIKNIPYHGATPAFVPHPDDAKQYDTREAAERDRITINFAQNEASAVIPKPQIK